MERREREEGGEGEREKGDSPAAKLTSAHYGRVISVFSITLSKTIRSPQSHGECCGE